MAEKLRSDGALCVSLCAGHGVAARCARHNLVPRLDGPSARVEEEAVGKGAQRHSHRSALSHVQGACNTIERCVQMAVPLRDDMAKALTREKYDMYVHVAGDKKLRLVS